MRGTIWLTCDRVGINKMTKGRPTRLDRGELAIKVEVIVDPECWGSPSLEQTIHIHDWRDGLTFPDVRLDQMTITPAEAEKIKAERAAEAASQLRALGYTVEAPQADAEE
jgi:hypothetical protein